MAGLNEAVETWGSLHGQREGMGLLVVMATDGGVVWASGSQIFLPPPPLLASIESEIGICGRIDGVKVGSKISEGIRQSTKQWGK